MSKEINVKNTICEPVDIHGLQHFYASGVCPDRFLSLVSSILLMASGTHPAPQITLMENFK